MLTDSEAFRVCSRKSLSLCLPSLSVIGFRDLPSEAALDNEYDGEVKDWPSKGEIDVSDLCVRYRPGKVKNQDKPR